MKRLSFVAVLLRLALNIGGVLLLLCGFNLAVVSPTLMKLVDLGPLGEEVEYSSFVWKFGIVCFLSGAGGLFFANVRRVPFLSRTHTEIDGPDSSKTTEWLGVAGIVFVCVWLLSRAGWLMSGQDGAHQSPTADPIVFVVLINLVVQGLALSGFLFNTFAHLWLACFPSERGAALALASACVQTGVAAVAIVMADVMRRGLGVFASDKTGWLESSPDVFLTAQMLFMASLLIIAWSRRRMRALP